jgi:hypothetical protein
MRAEKKSRWRGCGHAVCTVSNLFKPTEQSYSAKYLNTSLYPAKRSLGEVVLTAAIPNLNANGRRQAHLVCSLPLPNPNVQRGL